MDVTMEMQIDAALRSLWAMFPTATRITISHDLVSNRRGDAAPVNEIEWDVLVCRHPEPAIGGSGPVLAEVAREIMLKSGQKLNPIKFAEGVLMGHVGQISLN